MPLGARLALLALAALLAGLLLPGAAANHAANGVFCSGLSDCHINLRPNEDRSTDTWVDETAPTRNFDTGDQSEFLVVGAPQNQKAWALIRFPLQDLPRNITVLGASLNLRLAQADLADQRTLRLYELRSPWEEGTVTFDTAKNFDRSPTAVSNRTVNAGAQGSIIAFGGDMPFGCTSNCQLDGDRADRGVPASLQKYLRGEEPYFGHILRDDDNTNLNLPSRARFNSSADLTPLGHKPYLVVTYDPNTPDLRNFGLDGQSFVNASSTRPVNLSFEVFDRLGDVTNAWINATEEATGREVFNRSVFQNRTTTFINFDRHKVWSNQSLDLPAGRYVLNVLALDSDGNIAYTRNTTAQVLVENLLPFVNQSRDLNGAPLPFLSATDLNEGQVFHARLNASDASGIARVTLALDRNGEVVRNHSLHPTAVDANASGEWEADLPADVAGFLNATFWVEDRAGNANRSATFALRVRDVLTPVFEDARVLTPGRTSDGPIQEEGGVVGWEVRVRDASPVTVTLELTGPTGAESIPLARQGLTDVYRYERAFIAGGSYGATVVVEDQPDLPPEFRNRALRGQLGFFLLPPTPPAIDDLRPSPGGAGSGETNISAVVSDLNLDPGKITLETRVAPSPFLPAEARTVTVTETSRRIEFQDRFFHAETVEVRVRATDLLGRSSERLWTFSIDDRPPATFLTTEGPALAGERTALTGNTTLRLDRTDQGSGVLATVVAVVHEERNLGSGNLTITGSEPATLNLSASPVYAGTGNYTLFYSSVDKAGNLEPIQRRRFLVDDTAPRVQVTFEPGLLTARVEERGTGLREVRAFYWLAPGGQQGQSLMSPNADRTVWQAQLPDVQRGAEVLYAVEAVDQLGNLGRAGSAANPLRSIVQNHKPLVSISPGNNSLVRGTLTLEWAATDRDGDAVETSLAVRPSTSDEARSLAPRRGATGQYEWDTRSVGDGVWVVEVTARDNFEVVVARSLLDVSNTDSKIVDFRVAAGEPGQPVRVEATLYKPVQRAEAVVRLGDTEVARLPLRDDGAPPDRKARDGVFTGAFTPQQSGDYRVDLDVVFEDGRLESRDRAGVAQVQYAFPARIVNDPLLLFLAVVIPLGAGGFLLYRRYGAPRFLRQWWRRR